MEVVDLFCILEGERRVELYRVSLYVKLPTEKSEQDLLDLSKFSR